MPPAWVSYVHSGVLRSMDVRRNGATVRELKSSRRAQVQMLRVPQAIARRPTPPRWRGRGVPDETAARLSDSSVETQLKVVPWTALLDARRDHLGLTGTKKVAIMADAACARC
jgi:hypothetical protein